MHKKIVQNTLKSPTWKRTCFYSGGEGGHKSVGKQETLLNALLQIAPGIFHFQEIGFVSSVP